MIYFRFNFNSDKVKQLIKDSELFKSFNTPFALDYFEIVQRYLAEHNSETDGLHWDMFTEDCRNKLVAAIILYYITSFVVADSIAKIDTSISIKTTDFHVYFLPKKEWYILHSEQYICPVVILDDKTTKGLELHAALSGERSLFSALLKYLWKNPDCTLDDLMNNTINEAYMYFEMNGFGNTILLTEVSKSAIEKLF